MKFGIIGDFLADEPTGIYYYAIGIINSLKYFFPNLKFYYFLPKKQIFTSYYFNINKYDKKIYLDKFFLFKKRFLWLNLICNFINRQKLDYVFNFTGLPHLFKIKNEIMVVHDLALKLYPQFYRLISVLEYKMFYSLNLKNSKLILVNSFFTKRELINAYPFIKNKIHQLFIPYFYFDKNLIYQEEKTSNNFDFILNINTIEPRKNLTCLIKAFEFLKKTKSIPYKLIIVGKLGWKYKEILNLINKSPFNKDIILKQYIDENQKIRLIKKASLLIYPSFYEGLGLPILESIYYKKIIIVSKNLFIMHKFKNLISFVPFDYIDLGKKIMYALNLKKNDRDKIIKKNYDTLKKFYLNDFLVKENILNFIKILQNLSHKKNVFQINKL